MSYTIAAISTPHAPAGLGVIRISGEQALDVASAVFRPLSSARSLKTAEGYTALYGHVFDDEGDIDECVALVFRAPHSYTSENVVELSCHGGLYLLQRVLRAVLTAGASPAEAGEFTRRAFINGKMDLTRAEAVMELIAANGRLAAKTALAAREGALFHKLETVKNELIGIAANYSAFVDYPDDDIPELEVDALAKILTGSESKMVELLSTFDAGRIVREGIDTVIVGSPNVGKSTLMNLLAGCERSIVTPVAGTTRDVVEETIRLGDVVLRLADTAGIHATEDAVETIGVQRARSRMQAAALVLAVFDGSRPLTEDDIALIQQITETEEIRVLAIINKSDQPMKVDREYISNKIQQTVVLSAEKGDGLAELESAVCQVTGVDQLQAAEPMLATERQHNCAVRCLTCIHEAQTALENGMTLDAVSVSIDGAIAAILELTGECTTEAVVHEIFSRFCVGK